MGFKKIFISRFQKNISIKNAGIEIVQVGKIENLVKQLFA